MKFTIVSIISMLFAGLILTAAKPVVKTIGWELESIPGDCSGLPGWVKNPSAGATVNKLKSGLVFSVPEQGKEYRWLLNTGKVDLRKYNFLRISYRAEGVDKSSSGGYIIYIPTLAGQKLYPLVSKQLQVDSSLEGELHERIINLDEKSGLKDNAVIQKMVIGMKAASANARLYIDKLELFSDKEIDSAIPYVKVPQGRAIIQATAKYKDLISFSPSDKLPVTRVDGWNNDTVRGGDLITRNKDNLLYNGKFEKLKSGRLDGWSYELHDGAEGIVEFDDSFVKNGGRSLKITKTNGKGYIVVFSENAIPVKAGEKVAFQGFYHTRGLKDQQRTLGMVRLSQTKDDLRYDKSVDKWDGLVSQQRIISCQAGQWQKRVVDMEVKKNLPSQVLVNIIIYGNPATVWWDDLAIEPFATAKTRWLSSNPRMIDYWKPEQISDAQFNKMLSSDINHTAELKNINGKSALLVDGKLTPPVIYKGGYISPQNYLGGALDKAGVRIQMQALSFGDILNEDIPVAPGKSNYKLVPGMYLGKDKFDFDRGIELLRIAMKAAPDSLFLLELKLYRYADYVNDNPTEAWVDAQGQKAYGSTIHIKGFTKDLPDRTVLWPSYFSKKWQQDMTEAMRLFLLKLNENGLSKRVIGVQIVGGHDDQFAMPYLDYSSHALAAFRGYLRNKYQTVEALRTAWNKPEVTFENAALPIAIQSDNRFLDPAVNMDWYDYWKFSQSEILKIQENFALAAKKALGKKALSIKYLMSTHGGSYVSTYSMNQFFNSDVFDMTAPQPSYAKRDPGISFNFPQVLKSYNLHNKLVIGEFDLRTYCRTRGDSEVKTAKLGQMESFSMWQSGLRKLTGQMIASNQGYWFYDMHWGWFQKEIAKDIGEDFNTYSSLYAKEIEQKTSRTDLLVVLDEESLYWTAIGSKRYIFETIVNTHDQIHAIGNSGVPFDYILMEDLITHPELIDQYKVFVFNHSYRLDKQRNEIYAKLKKNKKTLVWLYAAGFVGETSRSVNSMKQLTGINIQYSTNKIDKSTVAVKSDHLFAQGLLERQDISSVEKNGDTLGYNKEDYYNAPYFFISDPEAKTIASYQQTGQGAIAVKEFPDWTSVYVATAAGLSSELLNNICRQAGAYVCTRPGLDISMNNNF
ncbi:MAG: hypothetical protein WC071_10250, partial [Victivallaceae bacterium]